MNSLKSSTKLTDSETLARDLAEDYAKYLDIDVTEEKDHLSNEIDTMIAELEEYKSVLTKSQSANHQLLEEQVNKIFTFYQPLLRTFQSIDNLEKLVDEMKADLMKLEVAVTTAEKDLRVGPNISEVFKPILFKRDLNALPISSLPGSATSLPGTYSSPELQFSPQNYFPFQEEPADKKS